MYSDENLLRSRHSVGSESDLEKEQAEVTDKEREQDREQRSRMYSDETCFEAAIQSEVKA
jgi:hypothetical protein